MFVSSHCFTHLSPPLSFPPHPPPLSSCLVFVNPPPSVQGASGLDGRPGPPVSSISPLPYVPLPQYRDLSRLFHQSLVYTRNNHLFLQSRLGRGVKLRLRSDVTRLSFSMLWVCLDPGITAYLFRFISRTRWMKPLHGSVMLCSPVLFIMRGLYPVVLHGSLACRLFTTVALQFCLRHNNASVFCPVSTKLCVLFSHMTLEAQLPWIAVCLQVSLHSLVSISPRGEVASKRPLASRTSPFTSWQQNAVQLQ